MKKNTFHFSSFFVIFACLLLLTATSASAASIKERMNARIPTINSLKDKGIVGENNLGLLEYRSAKKQEQVVADENKDRAAVYKAIGKKQGTTQNHVGQRRAKMIVNKGKKGHWFQRGDGSWYKK